MEALIGTIVYKFGRDPAIYLLEKAICRRTDDGRRALFIY